MYTFDLEVSLHECSLGYALIATQRDVLYGIELGETPDDCYRSFINRWVKDKVKVLPRENKSIVPKVLNAIEHGILDPTLKYSLDGTKFQKQVWQALQNLQPGETITYSKIANDIGNPGAVRAVGNACGANPIAIIVPCHRVVRADGSPLGYHWGDNIKSKLLAREKYVP